VLTSEAFSLFGEQLKMVQNLAIVYCYIARLIIDLKCVFSAYIIAFVNVGMRLT
jgi:hypothetical protein